MNVQQLIDTLSKMNKDAEVLMPDGLPIVSIENHDNQVYLVDFAEDEENAHYVRQLEEEYHFLSSDSVEY